MWLLKRLPYVLLAVLVIFSAGPGLQAQEEAACAAIVLQSLQSVDEACKDTGRNQACYGSRLVEVESAANAGITFEKPGDLTALTSIRRLHTAPLNLTTGEWGIALMKVQANLPDTLPGQNVTFLMTGDVSLTDASGDAESAPMQTFYFDSGIGESGCQSAPDSLVIQSPQGTRVTLNINGADINLGSTAVLETRRGESMDVLMVGGEGEITALDASQTVPAGQVTTIALGGVNGLTAVAPPTLPEPYDPARVQYVPFNLLPDTIEVPAAVPWVDTGIVLQTGQVFTVSVSGLVNTSVPSDGWYSAEGYPVDDACSFEHLGLDHWDCRCPSAGCSLRGAPLMALVGRIGNGKPFVVGPGGMFTASGDGNLWLSVNDDYYDDNGGAFFVIVTVHHASGAENPPTGWEACTVFASKTANLRSGPGIGYVTAGTLPAGTGSLVSGQATDADGYIWWQLTDGSWVRSDVVGAAGGCHNLPVVPAP